MSTTAGNIIDQAFDAIGERSANEGMSTDDYADALLKLNQMMASWATSRATVYALKKETRSCTSGTASFTMGPSGDIDSVRPVKIESAAAVQSTGWRQPLAVLTKPEWTAEVKDEAATAASPERIYPDYQSPLCTIQLHPKPNATVTVEINSWQQLNAFATTLDTVALPPGYELALWTNLAIKLAPSYGRPVTQEMAANAADALSHISSLNALNAKLAPATPPPAQQ